MLTYNDIIVVSAPSGAGKTTINKRLVQELSNIEMSVSYTTRSKRPGEHHGQDYWFKTKKEFNSLIDSERMLEWAVVFNNYYGTSLDELDRITSQRKRILLEIDVQGWRIAKNKLTNFTSVFILPPSGKALVDRLKKRGTDSKNSIYLRVQSAKEELSYINDFDYFIVNDQIEIAYTEMKHLVSYGRKPSLTKQEAILKCEEISRELSKYKY